jgi:FkbM family methyltransferase
MDAAVVWSSGQAVKQLLRRVLPADVVATLAAAHRRVDAAMAAALGMGLGVLPLRVRALTRSRMENIGRLDYPPGSIRLVVDSEAELARLRSCLKEPETVEWIERFIQPGEVVFDIGANVGAYSLVVDQATQGRCKVFAFEPSFSTFAQLNRNVLLNSSEGRVVPVQIALSDENGLVSFNYSTLSPGAALHALGESLDQLGRPFRPAFSQPVLSYRMDDFVAQFALPAPNHIKLDVDGVELKVLRGGAGILANPALRSVLVEVEPERQDFQSIQNVLVANGFSVYGRYPHGPTETSTTNLLFTREATQP